MKRVWPLLLVLAVVPGLAQKKKSACPPEGGKGLWSLEATYLCPQYKGLDFSREMRIQSPSREATVRVAKEEWWLEIGGQKVSLASDESRITENAEMAWAPDGKAFYITQSQNTAGVQGFHTEIYRVNDGRVEPLPDINDMVQREFDRHHKCTESADIGAVKRVDSSDRILMVAEVPLDSLCAPRGYFAGYLVSLTSREVIQRYSARELMARWKTVVGARLKEDFGRLTVKERDAVP